ncbi:hypothetical protein GC197_06060 [bacterium]|nr:hypothetical protein [bacterium]
MRTGFFLSRQIFSSRGFVLMALLVGAGLILFGCQQSPPDGYSISGTVNYLGHPLPRGILQMRPLAPTTEQTNGMSFQVINGEFKSSLAALNFHHGGKYELIIYGFDGIAQPGKEMPMGRRLFSEFVTRVDLPPRDVSDLSFNVLK